MDRFTISGTAIPVDAERMLCDICSHFAEYSDVRRQGDHVEVESLAGRADIRKKDGCLAINLSCPSAQMLQSIRNMIAENLFMFAGAEPLVLDWADQPQAMLPPDLTQATVIASQSIGPHLQQLTFRCADVARFVGGDMHVRLLMPPAGRKPVWPTCRPDGRIAWPSGEDELTVRVYTIRSVDVARHEFCIDFVLHASDGRSMPGADFGRDAKGGEAVGIMGPGGGGVPEAAHVVMLGDETALPAICRMIETASPGTRFTIYAEVGSVEDELPIVSDERISVTWLHRNGVEAGKAGLLFPLLKQAHQESAGKAFLWAACERREAKAMRDYLRAQGHDRAGMYVGAYWQLADR